MVKRVVVYISIILLSFSCKKSEDRGCWKFHGDHTERIIPLDSVNSIVLLKGLKYKIFQDTLNQIVVKGGENMVNSVDATVDNYELTIENKNKCNFLRSSDRDLEVEIHYPYYSDFYVEPSDSIVFQDTMQVDDLKIEIREAGGTVDLNVQGNSLWLVVSHGSGDFIVKGHTNSASLKIQHNGFGNASEFTADDLFVYQNSTADMYVNLTNALAEVRIEGPGNVYRTGSPSELSISGYGSGKLIEQ